MTSRKLASNTLWNLFGQILPLLLAVAVIPLLIKSMGVSRYGFLTLAWVLIGYAGLFDFGISRAMTRLVAKHVADGDKASADQVARAGSSFMLLFGSVVGLLLFGFSEVLVDRWLKVPPELKNEAINSLKLLALSVPIVLLTAAYKGVLEAHQAFKPLAMIRVVMGALTYLGPLMALTLSTRLEVVVGTIVLMRVLGNYLHARVCHQSTKYRYHWNVPDRGVTRRLFALGGWMSVSNIVSPLMTYMDRFILGGLVAIELVAYYSTPYDMITKVMILPYAFMGALFPVLAGMGNDNDRIQKTYSTTIRILFLLMLPITFTIIILAHPVMELWLGGTFALQGAPVLQILAIGVVANTLAQAPANLIQSTGNPKWMALLHIIELPLFLFAIWFFTTRYGIVGTAFSWTMRMVVDSLILFLLVGNKLTKFNFTTTQLICAVAASIAFLVAAFMPYSLALRLMVCGAGLVGFVLIAWFLVLTKEDKLLFTHLAVRRRALATSQSGAKPMQLTARLPHFKIPFKRIFIGALLSLALVMVAAFSGLIAATFPPNFAVVLGGVFGASAVFMCALMVPSKTVAPEKLMRGALSVLLFTWVVWPSYISYKFGALPGMNPTRLIYWGLISFWVYWVIASGNLKQKLTAAMSHHKLLLTALLIYPAWQLFCSFMGVAIFSSIYFTVKASAGGMLLFFVAISILQSREHVESALTWVLAAALVVAVIGLLEAVRGSNPFIAFLPNDPEQLAAMDWIVQDKTRSGAYRISSTFAHPLTLAEYLLMCIPIAGCLAAVGATGTRRILALVFLPISAVAIYATHTRSAMLGVGVLFVIIFAVIGISAIRKKGNFKGAVFGTFLLLSVLLASIAVGTLAVSLSKGRDRGEQGSTAARLIQLDIGANAVRSSPIYGYGPGMAAEKIGFLPDAKTLSIDNHYLSVALDTGLPGVAVYGLIFLFPIVIGLRLGLSGFSQVHLMALATSVALIAFSFEKIVLSLTHNFDFAYVLIAMTLVLKNIDLSRSMDSRGYK